MGYHDELYNVAYMIGYTGTVHLNPTVYFQRKYRYGHITQAHDIKANIGRERVGENPEYVIENKIKNGKATCIERIGDKKFHTSRNEFIPIAKCSNLQKAVLGQSVLNFTEQKPICRMSARARREAIYGAQIAGGDVDDLVELYQGYIDGGGS